MGAGSFRKVTLRWIHTSDLHGRMFMHDDLKDTPAQGGASAVYGLVESLRAEHPDGVICTDGGDCLQGQPVSFYYNYLDRSEPNLVCSMMNEIKYDAAVIGNHDIETGHEVYDRWIEDSAHPILAANMIDNATGEPYLKPYVVIERRGVRIAILGMITPTIDNWLAPALWSGVHFMDIADCARRWIPIIQEKENPHLIVGLFHSGLEGGIESYHGRENCTRLIAETVPGFDMILYGHDHKCAINTYRNERGKPVLTAAPNNNGVRIVELKIQLTMKGDRLLGKRFYARTPLLCGSIHPATILLEMEYEDKRRKALTWLNEEIGVLDEDLYEKEAYFGSCPFMNLIHRLQLQTSGADVSFAAPLSFDSHIPKGPITVRHIFNLYRYDNFLYTMKLSGREIKAILEMSYDRWTNTMQSPDDHALRLAYVLQGGTRLGFEHLAFNFISAGGIHYTVDVTKPLGKKVRITSFADGRPFLPEEDYLVAVNSYHGSGGGELITSGSGLDKEALQGRIVRKTENDLREIFIKQIKETGRVETSLPTRWQFVPTEWTEKALIRDKEILFRR